MTPDSPKRKPTALWYLIFIQYFVFALLVLFGYLYINSVDRRSDRDWCDLLTALTTDSPPPTSERAREIARLIEDLERKKGC